ncbi:MAG: diacylglycerol kinase family lipid kinase [Ferruginibacter sp.]|nr:diacylglycerol kinase family lipid kinase [Ferruginibacter sp.]
MPDTKSLRILFIINPGSGNNTTDWPQAINDYFVSLPHTIELFHLPEDSDPGKIKDKIKQFLPQQVVAVGGDGTIKMVAECLIGNKIPLGILPAGSANGLAKELGISQQPAEALNVIATGVLKNIHVTMVNNHLCIHLSDIGFNAFLIKKFESQTGRGMWGYLKASIKALFDNPVMQVEMQVDNKKINIEAAMIVIANGTRYGSGAVINPVGTIEDERFEVIAVKKISVKEIFKMTVSHASFDPHKTEVFQTNHLLIRSRKKVHFQVDGEYLGKVNEIKATIMPGALEIIVPS